MGNTGTHFRVDIDHLAAGDADRAPSRPGQP
jgi:hypothetical protein